MSGPLHINNIFDSAEFAKDSVVSILETTDENDPALAATAAEFSTVHRKDYFQLDDWGTCKSFLQVRRQDERENEA